MGCIVKTFIYQVTLTFLLGVSNDFIHLKLFLFFHTGVPLPWNGPISKKYYHQEIPIRQYINLSVYIINA